MKIPTYVETLSSSLDVGSIDKFLIAQRKTVEKILQTLRPEGYVDGNRYKLASLDGGQGKSFDFNLQNGQWGDWGKGNAIGGNGIVSFVSASQRCSLAQAVAWLVDEKYLELKKVRKSIDDADGDPLVFPIPEEHQSWDYVREQTVLKKDRGIITGHWIYRDVDGSLLGYKYRIDDRRTSKEVYTLSYRAESQWAKKAWDKKSVPPYGLEQLGDGTPTIRILFIEGEKAAEKARELFGNRWKVLSYSGVTGANDLWLPDAPFWSDCEVVIWPDNDAAGKDAARRVQLKLQGLQNKPRELRIVRVDTFAGLPPKWDLADHEEGCPIDPEVELERAQGIDSFESVCEEWVYVSQQDGFYNIEDRTLVWTATSFDRTYARYKDRSGSPSQKFLSDLANKQAHDLDFVPGADAILHSPSGKRFFNEWYDTENYAAAKAIAADADISDEMIAHNARFFIRHLERVAGNELAEPDYDPNTKELIPGTEGRPVLDALTWHFAELIRRPMDKRGWIPMMVSEENGTGKTYFRRMFQAVVGSTRARTITVNEFIGDYHDWADGLLFYELGEAKSQEGTEVYEELKKRHSYLPFSNKMLSDRTQNTQQLNIKTKAKKSQRDFLNGSITSNDLFPLALANNSGQDGSDRRLFVLNPRIILTEQETIELFDDELVNRAEWIGAYLIRYKAKHKWNPSWAPITAHKRLMLEKDRVRSENRADKTELGKFDEFFHMIRWAMAEKIGAFKRQCITSENIRAISEANRVKFPYDTVRFEGIVEKAGLYKGPVIKLDGSPKRCFALDASFLEKPAEEWKTELRKSINDSKDNL